jgi:hypothetical protein
MANGTTETTETTEQVTETREPVDILRPETCPPALKKFYNDVQRENIADAVSKGHIVTEVKNVKISKKNSGTNKDEVWPFILYRAIQAQGMTALAKGKAAASKPLPENFKDLAERDQQRAKNDNEDGACDYFNYGYGLTITQPIRVMLASKIGGTDKEVDKQIRQVMKTGLFATEDLARSFVISQRKSLNLAVPDAFADTDDDSE